MVEEAAAKGVMHGTTHSSGGSVPGSGRLSGDVTLDVKLMR